VPPVRRNCPLVGYRSIIYYGVNQQEVGINAFSEHWFSCFVKLKITYQFHGLWPDPQATLQFCCFSGVICHLFFLRQLEQLLFRQWHTGIPIEAITAPRPPLNLACFSITVRFIRCLTSRGGNHAYADPLMIAPQTINPIPYLSIFGTKRFSCPTRCRSIQRCFRLGYSGPFVLYNFNVAVSFAGR